MTDTDPFFCTYSGRCISVTNPDPSQIVIEDVARALSNIRRFGGHAHAPLTVAQHSVRVSYLCAHEDAYVGLLHDAQEMVVGDQISPIKKRIAGFKEDCQTNSLKPCTMRTWLR
jgi:5'-deoxynucleotidase YfbR-like HD superfamily hydrolase